MKYCGVAYPATEYKGFQYYKTRSKHAKIIANALADDELRQMARGPKTKAPSVEQIEKEIKISPGAWWIMYRDKKPVGWFRITPVDRWEANLGIVIFDPAYRYKEYGYNWVKDIMLPKVFPVFKVASWFTWDYNKASIGLAKKLGFELVDFTPNDRGSGATGLMFKLRGKE